MQQASVRDRAIGALVGLAVGDAVGTTLEFRRRDSYEPLTDMVGGGPFHLAPGEWTDDTSMALCLADSLIAVGGLSNHDLIARFVRWWQDGENSHNGQCFDIGMATRAALVRYRSNGIAEAGSDDPESAGNGSLMRLSPVAIRWWNDGETAARFAVLQSRTTHDAATVLDSCGAFARVLCDAIATGDRDHALRRRDGNWGAAVTDVMAGHWRGRTRNQISSTGYVLHSLEAALWCVAQAADFREAILLAANLGEDADTTTAITGQLAGAIWGMAGIPAAWLGRLAWREEILRKATLLFEANLAG